MTWVIRAGATRGEGQYLWEATPTTIDRTLTGEVYTAGGNWWQHAPAVIPTWDASQLGALIYTDRRVAVRVAKKVVGRVVKLRPKSCVATPVWVPGPSSPPSGTDPGEKR